MAKRKPLLELKDRGKMSSNRRLLDLERSVDFLDSEIVRMKDSMIKLTNYVNDVIDQINKDRKGRKWVSSIKEMIPNARV